MSTEPDSTAQKIHFGDDIKPVKSTVYSINRRVSLSEKDDLEADQKKFADQDRNHKKKQASRIPSTKISVTWIYAPDPYWSHPSQSQDFQPVVISQLTLCRYLGVGI
jgi:hypothetical protein